MHVDRGDVDVVEQRLAGSEPQPSWRAELQMKAFAKEEWPGKLAISTAGGGKAGAAAALADGEYERVGCRGSCATSSSSAACGTTTS